MSDSSNFYGKVWPNGVGKFETKSGRGHGMKGKTANRYIIVVEDEFWVGLWGSGFKSWRPDELKGILISSD
jgi:hypothetical protein